MKHTQTPKPTQSESGGWLLLTDADIEISRAGDDLEIVALTPAQVAALRAAGLLPPRRRDAPAAPWPARVHERAAGYAARPPA